MKKKGWAHNMTVKAALGALMAVGGAAKEADAGLITSRDTFGQASGTPGGVPSNFGTGQIASSAIGYSPATGYDWTLNTLQFAGILSSGITPNSGNMLNQDYLIIDVKDPVNFNVTGAKNAYFANQPYQYGDFYFRAAPDNPNYHIPYDTSGTFHLFNLTFSGFSFGMSASQDRYFSLIGLGQGGGAGNLGVAGINSSPLPDMFAINNMFGAFAKPNQDFGINTSYAMTFSGNAVPEPSSLFFVAVFGAGFMLTNRGNREPVSQEFKSKCDI
jgi:hypothetical protein